MLDGFSLIRLVLVHVSAYIGFFFVTRSTTVNRYIIFFALDILDAEDFDDFPIRALSC